MDKGLHCGMDLGVTFLLENSSYSRLIINKDIVITQIRHESNLCKITNAIMDIKSFIYFEQEENNDR